LSSQDDPDDGEKLKSSDLASDHHNEGISELFSIKLWFGIDWHVMRERTGVSLMIKWLIPLLAKRSWFTNVAERLSGVL